MTPNLNEVHLLAPVALHLYLYIEDEASKIEDEASKFMKFQLTVRVILIFCGFIAFKHT